MVKIGSGGANFGSFVNGEWYNDPDFILCRLPLAVGRQYIQNFWALQYQVRCKSADNPEKPSALMTIIR